MIIYIYIFMHHKMAADKNEDIRQTENLTNRMIETNEHKL